MTAQGIESRAMAGVADHLGPQVKSTTPWPNATNVERRTDIIARFDEPIDPASVGLDTMKLYRGNRRVCGRTVQQTRRFLAFEPCTPLGKKKQYTVKVSSVVDKLGNRGSFTSWRFTTR